MNAPPFAQLQAFLAVAREGSFSAAARELGVSRSAISQAVRQLERQLDAVLLTRTTRSVSLTSAGRRLVENADPALEQLRAALVEVQTDRGDATGSVRLSVPRAAVPLVIDPVVPVFRARHPRVSVEVVVEDRLVDVVAEGYDAGVRLSESVDLDMAQLRVTDPFRFVVVGSPGYLARHQAPKRPRDLLEHECITFRSPTSGDLYAWELERGGRSWRIPVRGHVVANEPGLCVDMALLGLGLAYTMEPEVAEPLRTGALVRVLAPYEPEVPGFFLFYPSRAQSSPALRRFIEVVKDVLRR
ncbi:MAG: LysR family transcriptional regulator [Sandaracinaceae bacterium]|nr:LysR family transcriptional regulator [Sandaracinaceae bacterium]